MHNILKHAHSGLRWVVLITILWAIINALLKWRGRKDFTEADKKVGMFALIATHIQFLLGLGLYFISPRVQFKGEVMGNSILRFFTVEHMSMMIIAILLITIGYSKAKRQTEAAQKFKTTFIFYLIGLLIMLIAIPWPFRELGGQWF